MHNSAVRLLLLVSVSSVAQGAAADIFKCTLPDGAVLFQPECPSHATASQKLTIKEVSDLGFNKEQQSQHSAGDALLPNGNFEQGLTLWATLMGTPQIANKEGTAGTDALHLFTKGNAPSKILLRQCLPAKGIGKASLSAFVKQEGATQPNANELRGVWFTSEDCSGKGQYDAQLNPTAAPGWQKLEYTQLKPALGAQSLLIELLHANAGGEPSQALWDDIEVTLTEVDHNEAVYTPDPSHTRPLGENHLKNSRFDANLDDWNSVWPTEWRQYGGEDVTGGIYVKASSDFGKKIRGEAFSQCVNFGTNTQFIVGASFKKDSLSSQTGSGSLRVHWLQKPGCQGKQLFGTELLTQDINGWQSLKDAISAPTGAHSALIKADQSVDDTGLFGAFWDNVFFIAQ